MADSDTFALADAGGETRVWSGVKAGVLHGIDLGLRFASRAVEESSVERRHAVAEAYASQYARARPAVTPPAGEVDELTAWVEAMADTTTSIQGNGNVIRADGEFVLFPRNPVGALRALAAQARDTEGLRATLEQVEHEVAEVYATITEGRFAKCNTEATYVIDCVNERHERDLADLREVSDELRERVAELDARRIPLPSTLHANLTSWVVEPRHERGRADDARITLTSPERKCLGTITVGWLREHTDLLAWEEAEAELYAEARAAETGGDDA